MQRIRYRLTCRWKYNPAGSWMCNREQAAVLNLFRISLLLFFQCLGSSSCYQDPVLWRKMNQFCNCVYSRESWPVMVDVENNLLLHFTSCGDVWLLGRNLMVKKIVYFCWVADGEKRSIACKSPNTVRKNKPSSLVSWLQLFAWYSYVAVCKFESIHS